MIRDVTGRWSKMRRRFGIAAPRVAIHTQIPWYWRWVGIAVLLGISAASAAWIYDAGRQFAGFDRSEVQQELRAARSQLEEARAELARVRSVLRPSQATASLPSGRTSTAWGASGARCPWAATCTASSSRRSTGSSA